MKKKTFYTGICNYDKDSHIVGNSYLNYCDHGKKGTKEGIYNMLTFLYQFIIYVYSCQKQIRCLYFQKRSNKNDLQ
jgi:hypothetical protein